MTKNTKTTVGLTLTILLALTGIGWAVWQLMALVPPTWARLWAIVATLLLPVIGWASYNLGLTEAKGKLKGIDAGLDKVTRAAAKVIDLRTQARQATREPQHVVMLPDVEPVITVRPQLESGEVEL